MSNKATDPLHLDVEFQNLGKINRANIKLRPFTVIAGCNGSGKSFVTRTLYSVFDSSTERELFSGVFENNAKISGGIRFLQDNFEDEGDDLKRLIDLGSSFDKIFDKSFDNKIKDVDIFEYLNSAISNGVSDICDDIKSVLGSLNINVKDNPKLSNSIGNGVEAREVILKDFLQSYSVDQKKSIQNACSELQKLVLNPNEFVNLTLSKTLSSALVDNFMVKEVGEIIGGNGERGRVVVSPSEEIEVAAGKIVYSYSSFISLKEVYYGSSVYLESPIYWKLIDALKSSKEALSETAQKRRLEESQLVSQVPKYFFDLLALLEVQVKTDGFSDIVHTIEDAINGGLSFSDGNIQFSDKASKASVGLNLTALGVANLGMIALLLKRGAILPGTFLFIDEPEVHLHPSWQVILIQVLHELSKRGVNVVIASHSIDIMKAIENIMDTDDSIDPQTHFGINQLTKDGNSVDESENNYKRLAAIKEDLGRPFYEMFMDNLGS